MRKQILGLLILSLIFFLLPAYAQAAPEVIANGNCGLNGGVGYGGDELQWTYTNDGTLTISGNGDMDRYAYSGSELGREPWLAYESEITRVIVEEGVKSIGDYAFSSCTKLTNVTLPSTLVEIRTGAFYECTALTEIVIPDSVTIMGNSVFGLCQSLKNVTLPAGITAIPGAFFKKCTSLTSFTVPQAVTKIGSRAFESCANLKTLTIPNSVKEIESYAFSKCSSLATLTLPSALEKMGNSVFEYCDSLTELAIPASVTTLAHTFENATGLKTIAFLGDCPGTRASNLFGHITITAYYPKDNATWTPEVRQNYGGTATWIANCGTAHIPVTDAAQAAQCTKPGLTEGSHCSECGKVLVAQQSIPAKNHSYGSWTQTAAPQIGKAGEEQRTCNNCNAVETRSIDALPAPESPELEGTQPPESEEPPVLPTQPADTSVLQQTSPATEESNEQPQDMHFVLYALLVAAVLSLIAVTVLIIKKRIS